MPLENLMFDDCGLLRLVGQNGRGHQNIEPHVMG